MVTPTTPGAQPTPALHYSLTVFHHDFDRLRTIEPALRGLSFQNRMEGTLTGINAWASYRATPAWRLTGGGVKMRRLPRKGSMQWSKRSCSAPG